MTKETKTKKDTTKSKKTSTQKQSKSNELKKEVQELQQKLNDTIDRYTRLSAEFDNYRKRTLKEKIELTKNAGEEIYTNLLPISDDFDRAIKALQESKDIDAVKEGMHLIYDKFTEFLTKNGIKEIETIGKEFDTDLHEAITKIPAPTAEQKGKIIDVTEKGYYLNDKVIRFAKVVIGE